MIGECITCLMFVVRLEILRGKETLLSSRMLNFWLPLRASSNVDILGPRCTRAGWTFLEQWHGEGNHVDPRELRLRMFIIISYVK